MRGCTSLGPGSISVLIGGLNDFIVCINGVFGMRMQENITRFGGVAVVVEDDWGTAVSLVHFQF
jgi:aspartate aminotransferase-like enzyme